MAHGLVLCPCRTNITLINNDLSDTKSDVNTISNELSSLGEILWENPTPSASTFAPQTINVDLSETKLIAIQCNITYSDATSTTGIASRGDVLLYGNVGGNASVGCAVSYRKATVTDSGITFGHSYQSPTVGSGALTTDNRVIPYRVIKLL